MLDCCAISLPVGAPGGPPIGVMLMAAHGRDHDLFDVAEAIEAALQDHLLHA